MEFTLAHLTDPHLTSLGAPGPALLGKRLMGYLSWHLNRRWRYQATPRERLEADIQSSTWDHCVVTGDLTQIATAGEIHEASRWLAQLGSSQRVTVVPGNHDAYGRAADLGCWAPWGGNASDPRQWPLVRRWDGLTLIGLCSAVVSPPGYATGTLGDPQLSALADILRDHRETFRVVLIHHPPLVNHTRERKSLTDAAALTQVLASEGVELLLHGHGHRNLIYRTALGDRLIPVASLGSASAVDPRPERRAAWQRIAIRTTEAGWAVTFERRPVATAGQDIRPEIYHCQVPAAAARR